MTKQTSLVGAILGFLRAVSFLAEDASKEGWSEQQVSKLPSAEKPVRLFNGKDLIGWKGHTGKCFSVEDGIIIARNGKENAPQTSTYLVTDKDYRNFRLIFEAQAKTR